MEEHIMPIERVNKIALIILLPAAAVLIIPFMMVHGIDAIKPSNLTFKNIAGGTFLFLAVFLVGGAIHELLHGISWSIFTIKGWKAISFGIKWEYLTPYCHCDEPLKKKHFMFGAIMPLLVLGLAPLVISYFTGSFKIWFFGFFFSMAAMGDIVAVKMLWKVPNSAKILDHPSEMGFLIDKPAE